MADLFARLAGGAATTLVTPRVPARFEPDGVGGPPAGSVGPDSEPLASAPPVAAPVDGAPPRVVPVAPVGPGDPFAARLRPEPPTRAERVATQPLPGVHTAAIAGPPPGDPAPPLAPRPVQVEPGIAVAAVVPVPAAPAPAGPRRREPGRDAVRPDRAALRPTPAAGPPDAPRDAPPPTPTVQISIGRIEIRAVPPAVAPPPPPHRPPAAPVRTLADYLRGDDGRPR